MLPHKVLVTHQAGVVYMVKPHPSCSAVEQKMGTQHATEEEVKTWLEAHGYKRVYGGTNLQGVYERA